MYSDYIDKGCVKRYVFIIIFILVMYIKDFCIFIIFINYNEFFYNEL